MGPLIAPILLTLHLLFQGFCLLHPLNLFSTLDQPVSTRKLPWAYLEKNHSCTPVVCWVSMATRVRSNENCSSSAICGLIDFALAQLGEICFEIIHLFPGLHVFWFMEKITL